MTQQINFKKYKPAKGCVLVLKSLPKNLKAYNDFQWPTTGIVTAPDWENTQKCGNGLHGWLWGQGNASLRCGDSDAVWMVLETQQNAVIDLDGKCKFESCKIKFAGDLHDAVAIIQYFAPAGTACIFGTATAGDGGTATAGSGGVIVIEYYDGDNYVKKCAIVDNVNFFSGQKYRINNGEFERVNDTV